MSCLTQLPVGLQQSIRKAREIKGSLKSVGSVRKEVIVPFADLDDTHSLFHHTAQHTALLLEVEQLTPLNSELMAFFADGLKTLRRRQSSEGAGVSWSVGGLGSPRGF